MTLRLPSSAEMITLGIVLLWASLVDRWLSDTGALAAVTSWLGSILVIVGFGRLLFLDS